MFAIKLYPRPDDIHLPRLCFCRIDGPQLYTQKVHNLAEHNIELTRAQSAKAFTVCPETGDSGTKSLGVAFNDLLCRLRLVLVLFRKVEFYELLWTFDYSLFRIVILVPSHKT